MEMPSFVLIFSMEQSFLDHSKGVLGPILGHGLLTVTKTFMTRSAGCQRRR